MPSQAVSFPDVGWLVVGYYKLAQFLVEFNYSNRVYRFVRVRSGNCIRLFSVVL